NGKVSINYILSEKQDNDIHEVLFYSYEEPAPTFREALQNLAKDVVEILELPAGYVDDMTITGVSLKHEEYGLGCCIQAIKCLNNNDAPFCINTPYKPPVRESTIDDKKSIKEELVSKLDTLQFEANKYLNGERAQGELFDLNSRHG